MRITRTSIYSGVTRTRELPVTQAQLDAHRNGVHAQYAFTDLPAMDREFIISGMTETEWNQLFQFNEPFLYKKT